VALPHFKPVSLPSPLIFGNPIYKNLCVVKFKDEYMKECCYSIEKDVMKFHVNSFDNCEIKPLDKIQKMIKDGTKMDLDVEQYDKEGSIIYHVVLEDFYFVKFKNFLNFDWNTTNLQSINVKFKYKKMTYLNVNQYKSYMRKLKLQKIENSF
jgi:hypothetical protein